MSHRSRQIQYNNSLSEGFNFIPDVSRTKRKRKEINIEYKDSNKNSEIEESNNNIKDSNNIKDNRDNKKSEDSKSNKSNKGNTDSNKRERRNSKSFKKSKVNTLYTLPTNYYIFTDIRKVIIIEIKQNINIEYKVLNQLCLRELLSNLYPRRTLAKTATIPNPILTAK